MANETSKTARNRVQALLVLLLALLQICSCLLVPHKGAVSEILDVKGRVERSPGLFFDEDNEPHVVSRKTFVLKTMKSAAIVFTGSTLYDYYKPASAYAASDNGPEVTGKVFLKISMDPDSPVEQIVIGLYGKEAPITSTNFMKVATANYREGISYDFSTVFRVDKDRRIDMGRVGAGMSTRLVRTTDSTGRVRTTKESTADGLINRESNDLKHDRPYLVSMKRGGGTYEFSIVPSPNSGLDKENIVFGEVISGKDIIDAINAVPTTQEDPLGSKEAFSSAGKNFDPRAKIAYVNKPLKKIVITKAGSL
uniref:PPIase cyclophilin-type domain-containing protein n=1 Tax=Fibrocapsa japonica TaxID=94617 RepID=A0A7S2XZB5_9STRA|mmetsp:Transcript_24282/g.35310  ORF Transcript_24282/g.35310 Transcript_24282/m.35310 type:complete len:309 (+) Transcript_24282:53-979(+)